MLTLHNKNSGAATVEFQIVALLALLPLCLGMLQMALLMSDNHHLDHAAFQAARHAAMRHGDLGAARNAFARASTPLMIRADNELDAQNASARVLSAYASARADQALFARFSVVSPSADAQADFRIRREGWMVIPNDGLEYRPRTVGERSGLSVQQANILRLRIVWCRPLVVPLIRQLLISTLRAFDEEPWHQFCYSQGRIPIRTEGASPMQSDFRAS